MNIEAFSAEIKEGGYKWSKGGFQIAHKDELPIDLIKNIEIWCKDNLDK